MRLPPRYAIFCSLLPGLALFAEPSASEAAFNALRLQRDKAIAEAVAPINRRYRADLEGLQKRATQTGDLDGALKIRNELTALDASAKASAIAVAKASDTSGSKNTLKSSLMAKKWKWGTGSSADKLSFHGKMEFLDDGKLRKWGEIESFLGGWEFTDGRILVKHVGSKNGWTFKYDETAQTLRATRAGSWDTDKWLVQVEDVPDKVPASAAASSSDLFGRKPE